MSYTLYVSAPSLGEDAAADWADNYAKYVEYGRRGRDICSVMFVFTYNLYAFFTRFRVNPIRDLDGMTGEECADRISDALIAIARTDLGELDGLNPRIDPETGLRWGDWEGACEFLRKVRTVCEDHPDWIVRERS